MAAKQLEAYLFYKFKLVGLNPGDRIKLFDLLVKTKGGGLGGKRIINLGSFLQYRLSPADAQASEYQNPDGEFSFLQEEIERGLKALEDDPRADDFPEDSIFTSHRDFHKHRERISTATGLGAKLLHFFGGQCSSCHEVECTIANLFYHGVTEAALHELFVGDDGAGLWKPDMKKISLTCNPKEQQGLLEIWVVKEKDFCDKSLFDGVLQTSAEVSATVDAAAASVGAQAGTRAAASRHTDNFHQLGFKAIRLFYNRQGVLVKWRPDMGDRRPTVRYHDQTDASIHDQFMDYNLGGLFVEPPPDSETDSLEHVSLQPLEIESVENFQLEA